MPYQSGNSERSTESLGNNYITTTLQDLNEWEFPDTQREPGEYQVVFASGNDEPDSSGNLHTIFCLRASGEYLALVMPNAATIVSQFQNHTLHQDSVA